jgi:hypothetical protein
MSSSAVLTQLPVSAGYHAAPAVAPDADFDARWDEWIARGQVHEQRARQRFLIWAGVLAIGAANAYAFLRP